MTCTEPAHERWDYVVEILTIFRDLDIEEELFWRVTDGVPTFWLLCSDTFAWAMADGEDIEPSDMPLLRQTIADLKETGATHWMFFIAPLFAARKRWEQPMKPWMERLRRGDYHEPDRRTPEQIQAWFDEHGEGNGKVHRLFSLIKHSNTPLMHTPVRKREER